MKKGGQERLVYITNFITNMEQVATNLFTVLNQVPV